MGSASTNEPSVGSRFGRYRPVRRLAVGGTAELFLAVDEASSKRVVLKISFDASTDPGSLEHEAAIGARLVHPAIVRILGVAREGETTALVSEFVEGLPLAAIASSGPFTRGAVLRIVTILAEALDHAHDLTDESGASLGVVHRDVNPANVLISRTGEVKLLDFGIARSRLARSRTRTGSLKGTLRYLAPEQATGSDVDRRTDVYALGLVAYELLRGEPFLRGEGDLELLRAAEVPPTLEERGVPDDLPTPIRSALGKALARFPEERFGTARAFANALVSHAGDADTTRTELAARVAEKLGPADVEPRPEAPGRPARSRAAIGVAIGLSLLGVTGLAASRLRGSNPDEHEPATPAISIDARTADGGAEVVVPSVDLPRTASDVTTSPDTSSDAARGARTSRYVARESSSIAATPPPGTTEAAATSAPDPPPAAVATAPTRESVRGKLARADARLRSARDEGHDVGPLESLSRRALEAYVDGRYAEADVLLDRLLASIP